MTKPQSKNTQQRQPPKGDDAQAQKPKTKTPKSAPKKKQNTTTSLSKANSLSLIESHPSNLLPKITMKTSKLRVEGHGSGVHAELSRYCIQKRAIPVQLDQESQFFSGVQGFHSHYIKLSDFVDPAQYSNWDQYRFRHIKLYVRHAPTTAQVDGIYNNFSSDIFSSYDEDDHLDVSDWQTFNDRANIKHDHFSAFKPMAHIGTYEYIGNFNNTSGDDPSNVVPTYDDWWDAATANSQTFQGVKLFFHSPDYNFVGSQPITLWVYATCHVQFKFII